MSKDDERAKRVKLYLRNLYDTTQMLGPAVEEILHEAGDILPQQHSEHDRLDSEVNAEMDVQIGDDLIMITLAMDPEVVQQLIMAHEHYWDHDCGEGGEVLDNFVSLVIETLVNYTEGPFE